jgi:hypothetical protein
VTTYKTRWGADTIEIRADFTQASCQVIGTNGRQVADFRHRPADALRYAVRAEAVAEGFDPDDPEVAEAIDDAVAGMEVIDSGRAIEVGRRIGRAMARDARAEDMSTEWAGLDAQDGDVATEAGLVPDTPEWETMEAEARRKFEACLRD